MAISIEPTTIGRWSGRSVAASVVVCTRNRGRRVRSTVASVLRNDWPFELIVIDQSDDDVTYEGLTSLLDDPRLRYIRSRERGLSRSRNLGIAEARHELIIMTDDDCVVPPSFVQTMVEELTMGERVAMVFADVVEPVSSDLHWTPTNEAHSDYTVSAVRGWKSNDGVNIGIGAAMGFRKSVVLGVGGFDEQLGAGARYHSAEDTDIVLRLLLRHHRVHRTTRTWVDHLGARTVSETRNVIHGAMFGMAVASGKLIRHRQWEVVPYFLGVAWLMVIKVGVLEIINGRRPPVLGRSRQLVGGLIEGLRHPGDRSTLLFRPLEPEVPPSSP